MAMFAKMRLHFLTYIPFALFAETVATNVNFPFESVQLTDAEIGNFSAIAFGDRSAAHGDAAPECKAYPGSEGWPLEEEWVRLNNSVDGVLLKPVPAAAVCYEGPYHDQAQCDFLLQGARRSRFYINDPLTVLTEWPEGDTCFATASTVGLNCTQGGFPVYVVNATTVKHIQIAVNFARNKNLRLVIK